jgi:nucleotide-binding universal stress UspA family protein
MTENGNGLVVLGVDGSEGSERALGWAAEEAKLRSAKVRVVTAWHVPAMAYGAGFAPMVSPSLDESTRQAAETVAKAAAEELRGKGLQVDIKVCNDQAADALIEESRNADLLVVGSRGHGGFTGLLLGSVGQQCVHHATCPVVVIR